ncbi:MAG: carbamoyltransferase C-terminal domain-containing protein [Candidatus Moranbacteria bacterium]|nr:carbamoyltransferase C-terminal domain-containing protein [Candidatus Moranbacteria bacterium]
MNNTKKDVYTLGINSAYHEPSVCLIKNGKVIAAVEEERFNRMKHGKHCLIDNPHELPYNALDYCLKQGGITLDDVDQIGFTFNPINRLTKNIGLEEDVDAGDWGSEKGERLYYKLSMSVPQILEKKYKAKIAHKWNWLPHHTCHAASAYYDSPFSEAAVMTFDGIGEFASITLGYGKNNNLSIFKEAGEYPSSLGFQWTKASRFLGILVDGAGEYGAGKIMALASYGNPDKYYETFKKFLSYDKEGNFVVDGDVMQFRKSTHENFEKMFGFKARKEDGEITQDHMDFAAALQKITNEIMLGYAQQVYKLTKQDNLCMAGGVTLNCTSNTNLLEKSRFKDIYIQPGANDMGTSVGAAYYCYHEILGQERRNVAAKTPYTGPEYGEKEILKALKNEKGVQYVKVTGIEKATAKLIAEGKVIGWVQGRAEFGPRALGNRSLLGDPRKIEMFKRISLDIKKREWYRPLAPIVMDEYVDQWFNRPKHGAESDKWMLFAYPIRTGKRKLIPAVTHHDGTGRVQVVSRDTNSRLHKLISHFNSLTGVPVLINTSFNSNEPMVLTPEHAINTFLKSGKDGIDVLVIGSYLITRKDIDAKKLAKHKS